MTSIQHHYGVTNPVSSTPNWIMEPQHQFGAKEGMASTNNIERFREERNWKRPELARRMGTTPQQIERLEKGQRNLTLDWIDKAAVALGVMPAEIITELDGNRRPLQALVPATRAGPDVPPTRTVDSGETVEIIQLDLSLPMGPGATIDDYIEEEPRLFDLAYIRGFSRTPPHRLRLARGVGDSMYPTLVSSDMVWIDSTQTNLNQQDRVWAVSINGAAAIKRLRSLKGGRVLVVSDNPAIENYEVEADEIMIGGRVIRFARDL